MCTQCPCFNCINLGWEIWHVPECPPEHGCKLDEWPSVCENCDGKKCAEKILCPQYVSITCSYCKYYDEENKKCIMPHSKYYNKIRKPTDIICNYAYRYK